MLACEYTFYADGSIKDELENIKGVTLIQEDTVQDAYSYVSTESFDDTLDKSDGLIYSSFELKSAKVFNELFGKYIKAKQIHYVMAKPLFRCYALDELLEKFE